MGYGGRSQWQPSLRRRSAASRLLRLWFRIPLRAWMSVCSECCVLPGTGLCEELIARPEESYWLWCVVVCDLEISWMRRPLPNGGRLRQNIKKWCTGCETDQSLPSTAEFKNEWNYNFTPLYALSECIVQNFYLIASVAEMLQTKRTVCRFISIITFMSLVYRNKGLKEFLGSVFVSQTQSGELHPMEHCDSWEVKSFSVTVEIPGFFGKKISVIWFKYLQKSGISFHRNTSEILTSNSHATYFLPKFQISRLRDKNR
jgi:hypothetical protein